MNCFYLFDHKAQFHYFDLFKLMKAYPETTRSYRCLHDQPMLEPK